MEKTLGVFVSRERVASARDFFSNAWELLQTGPLIIRPKRCGSYEPFPLVQDVDLKTMLDASFFTSNGRRSLCSVWPPAFHHSRYFSIGVLLRIKHTEGEVAGEVYDWLRSSFQDGITYMGTPTQAMFNSNIELHQILNCGAAEQDLPKLREHRDQLDCFHEVA
jgi:hypothetical protein